LGLQHLHQQLHNTKSILIISFEAEVLLCFM
jgi:hypothetical protein